MVCEHCCGANRLFDLKSARKELKKYKKKGAQSSTRKLIQALSSYNVTNKSLLDIGGGIGAIQWHFLNNGASATTDVDASEGYLQVAHEYSEELDRQDQTTFRFGDVTDIADDLPQFDFVTLDKVVCCYPDYNTILQSALNKCNKVIALTFPLGGPLAQLVLFLGRIYLRLTNNPFRPYIHSAQAIDEVITFHGFKAIHKSIAFPWRVWVYEKSANSRL